MKGFLKLFLTAVFVLVPLALTVGIVLDATAVINGPVGENLPDMLTADIWDGLAVHVPETWSGALLIQLLLPVWCMFDIFSGRKTDGWNHAKDHRLGVWLLPCATVAVAALLVLLLRGVPVMLWFLMGSIGYPLLVAALTFLISFLLVVVGIEVLVALRVVGSALRPAKAVE